MPASVRCVQCGICSSNCPRGIDVRGHAWRGVAIHDSSGCAGGQSCP